ncbi:MAG: hypothetical protein AAFR87_02330 [Bacteroidota bacterium]
MKYLFFTLALGCSLLLVAPVQASTPQGEVAISLEEKVVFTLRNNSLKSIPLLIPGVMNPNLSPQSNSGVTLKVGQKILFKYKGKKRILLIVDESLEGKTLNVSRLLKEKKREIDQKK